jgi:hypothetical protein
VRLRRRRWLHAPALIRHATQPGVFVIIATVRTEGGVPFPACKNSAGKKPERFPPVRAEDPDPLCCERSELELSKEVRFRGISEVSRRPSVAIDPTETLAAKFAVMHNRHRA